jgi:hypothetical protein
MNIFNAWLNNKEASFTIRQTGVHLISVLKTRSQAGWELLGKLWIYSGLKGEHSPLVSQWSRYINMNRHYNNNSNISFISKTKQRG